TPTAGMLNPYTYATGDPINHTDPTGQSPANAGEWIKETILDWEGLPYLDIGLALGGVLTAATGGFGAPLYLAMAGAALTLPAAADQIKVNTTGEGFMNEDTRTAFTILSTAGAALDIGVTALKGITKAKQIYSSSKGAAAGVATPPTGAAAAGQVRASAPAGLKGTDIENLFNQLNEAKLMDPAAAAQADLPAFKRAYGNGELGEMGQNAHAQYKAEMLNGQKPLSTNLAEPKIVPYNSAAHADILRVETTKAYLGARINEVSMAENVEELLPALNAVQTAIGSALPRQYVKAGITDWTRLVNAGGESVLDNGGAVRGIRGILGAN
ncbi:hypothetical protein ACFZAV_27755, partial [Streptomyces sp. NPDC008343]|uniref:hypothetical protein n=1 Tax=Streptomyces sp. NPDC008343 TaxID=3364828 RepID=UPI0036E4E566